MDFVSIRSAAEKYGPAMNSFLRQLIAIPGESCEEGGVIARIKAEMEALGFDRVQTDPMGNLLGFMGHGEKVIAFDGHIDTVGVGERSNWRFDPYEGYENETEIGGRGASDQLGGIVSSVYGARIMKDMGLIPEGYSVAVTATVQEEDCDGLCWQYIVNEDKLRPEFVVSTEPTDGQIDRGQRGRMEIRVEVKGVSCHGSAPERGDNAIYKMADILEEIRELNTRLVSDDFLGRGTVTVSQIFYNSPSRCAVADFCAVSLDRRLTAGETADSAIAEIKSLPSAAKYGAEVTMYSYERPSYTGLVYPTEAYFPTWVLPEGHPVVQAAANAHRAMFGEPEIGHWTFSTNAVSITGRYGIPCVGFGPGREDEAHAPNEKTWKNDLVKCAAIYAAIPVSYAK